MPLQRYFSKIMLSLISFNWAGSFCGFRKILKNEYLLAKIGAAITENGPPKGPRQFEKAASNRFKKMNYNKQPESQRGQTPQAVGGGAVAAGLDEAEHALDRRTKLLEPSGLLIWTN